MIYSSIPLKAAFAYATYASAIGLQTHIYDIQYSSVIVNSMIVHELTSASSPVAVLGNENKWYSSVIFSVSPIESPAHTRVQGVTMKISHCRSARGLRPRVCPLHPQLNLLQTMCALFSVLVFHCRCSLGFCCHCRHCFSSRLAQSLVLRSSMVSFLLSPSPSFMCVCCAPHPRGLAAQVRYFRVHFVCFLLVSWLYCILWSLPSH